MNVPLIVEAERLRNEVVAMDLPIDQATLNKNVDPNVSVVAIREVEKVAGASVMVSDRAAIPSAPDASPKKVADEREAHETTGEPLAVKSARKEVAKAEEVTKDGREYATPQTKGRRVKTRSADDRLCQSHESGGLVEYSYLDPHCTALRHHDTPSH